MGEKTLQNLLDKYAYLDDLDNRGWAWEFLRRHDEYQSDYLSIQGLEHPEPFNREHKALAEKWNLKRMMDPRLHEIPEFFYERYKKFKKLIWSEPIYADAILKEMRPPGFSNRTGKNSIICLDLKVQGLTQDESAELMYPGHKRRPQETYHHPLVHRIAGDLKRFKKLQAYYIKRAYA